MPPQDVPEIITESADEESSINAEEPSFDDEPIEIQFEVPILTPIEETKARHNVDQALKFALKHINLRHRPHYKQDLSDSQNPIVLRPLYLSEAQGSFNYSECRPSLQRSLSEVTLKPFEMRRANGKSHLRMNSSNFVDQLVHLQASVKNVGSLRVAPMNPSDAIPAEKTQDMTSSSDISLADQNADPRGDAEEAMLKATEAFLHLHGEDAQTPSGKNRFDSLWNSEIEGKLAGIDVDNTWFTLREVLELTLMHTQQTFAVEEAYL